MAEYGPEIGAPGEGGGGAPEELSEEAKQRFAAAAAGMQAARREEKKSKKRDTRVARAIIQFLGDEKYTHLFVLISRLVARDCPSVFILAILSLINDECFAVVEEYLREAAGIEGDQPGPANLQVASTHLDLTTNKELFEWITRLQMVLSLETVPILTRLMIDEGNIDGTVLQLTTFVLQDFFESEEGGRKKIPFENLHAFAASVLQSVFEPFLDAIDRSLLAKPKEERAGDDDDDE